MERGETRATAVAVAAAVAASLPVFLIGPLAPQLRADLGFGRAQLGLAFGLCQATSATTSWVLGSQVVRLGSQRATRIGLALSAFSLAGIGLVADSYLTLIAFLAVCGTSSAICQPATNALLLDAVAPGRLGRAFGVKLAAIPLTALVAGLAVPTIATPLGWRWAFLLALALPIASAIWAPAPLRARPRPSRSQRSSLTSPTGVLVLLAVGVGLIIGSATTVPGFFVESAGETGIGADRAALILAAGAGCGIVARLILGAWTDRTGAAGLRVVAVMSGLGASGFVLLGFQHAVLQSLGVLLVFVLGWGWVGLFQYLLSTINSANPGAATGITDTGGYLGAFLGPTTIGIVAERHSFQPAWLVAFVATIVGSMLVVIASRCAPDRPEARSPAPLGKA